MAGEDWRWFWRGGRKEGTVNGSWKWLEVRSCEVGVGFGDPWRLSRAELPRDLHGEGQLYLELSLF